MFICLLTTLQKSSGFSSRPLAEKLVITAWLVIQESRLPVRLTEWQSRFDAPPKKKKIVEISKKNRNNNSMQKKNKLSQADNPLIYCRTCIDIHPFIWTLITVMYSKNRVIIKPTAYYLGQKYQFCRETT